MALRDDIMAAVKDAMKSGDKKRLGTLRLMQAEPWRVARLQASRMATQVSSMRASVWPAPK